MEYFSVKNMDRYQHYTDRCPPWIKLHRSIFDDYEFSCLQDASKLQLILIFLLASQMDNRVPADPTWLKQKLGVKGTITLKPLFDNGFLVMEQVDSNALADCKQNGGTEKRRGEDINNTETEGVTLAFEEDWDAYPRKAGSKAKALSCYKKSVNTPAKRESFQAKTAAYLKSCDDPQFIKHGETWFRNWEDHQVDPGAGNVVTDAQRQARAELKAKKKELGIKW